MSGRRVIVVNAFTSLADVNRADARAELAQRAPDRISDLPSKGVYARFLRTLRAAAPDVRTIDPMSGWMRHERTVREIRADARLALDRRINARGGNHAANEPMPLDLERDARDLDACLRHRVRIYQWRTELMRARFSHLLASRDD